MWVPIRVVNDDRVRRREIYPEASSPRGEQEEPCGGVGAVEVVDALLPLLPWDGSVNTAGPVPPLLKVALHEIEHLCHLRKDEHLVVLGMKAVQEALEELHLAALPDHLGGGGVLDVGREGARNQVGAARLRGGV